MAKKLTFDEVVKFIEENSDCIPLFDSFDKTTDKINLRCNCGEEFITTFAKFKTRNKRQCNDCSKEKLREEKAFNIRDVKDFIESNSECKLMSKEYINAQSKLLLECSCGNKFETNFNKFKSRDKRQCNDCSKISFHEKTSVNIEYVNDFVNNHSNCKLISDSVYDSNSILKFKCQCGDIFETSFNNFKNGNQRQCKKCGAKMRVEWCTTSVSEIVKYIETNKCKVLSKDIVDIHSNIKIQCKCGNDFVTNFENLRRRKWCCCDECTMKFKISERLTPIKEIENIIGEDFNIVGNFEGKHKTISLKHKKCGQIFDTTICNFERNGKRCLCCNKTFKGEQKITDYLNDNNEEFQMQHKYDNLRGVNNGLLSYDFYLEQYNLLIEYQGQYHDGTARNQTKEQFEIQQEHDRRKKEYTKSHNIELLEIWYWDFDNIETILNNKLNNERENII